MQLTLFRLCISPDEPCKWAPNVWKTILDMRLLGVKYETQLVTLAQLAEQLPARFGRSKVTSPTILITQGGSEKCIGDSYEIAQYLEDNYASRTKSIFVSTGEVTPEASLLGRGHARFIEQWVNKTLVNEIRPCVIHTSYAQFPTEGNEDVMKSRTYHLSRYGQTRYEQLVALNSDTEWRSRQYARIRKELSILEVILSEKGKEGPFLAGSTPTHADFCVFAYYVYSLTNPCMVRNTWRHPSLPCVSNWLDSLLDSGLIEKDELLPENIDDVQIIPEEVGDPNALLKLIL